MKDVFRILRGICRVIHTFRQTKSKRRLAAKIKPSEKIFDIDRYLVSESFPELAKKMTIPNRYARNLVNLEEKLLLPIESQWGRMEVLSGYRSKELNDAVGGSKTSDHLIGAAADITTPEVDLETLFEWIIQEGLPFRQVIFYPQQQFIHISINTLKNKFKIQALLKTENGYEEVKLP